MVERQAWPAGPLCVSVWTTEDRDRWVVEIREGGTECRSRYREVPAGHEAMALAMLCCSDQAREKWRDISCLARNRAKQDNDS
jgi:hypothetical protein